MNFLMASSAEGDDVASFVSTAVPAFNNSVSMRAKFAVTAKLAWHFTKRVQKGLSPVISSRARLKELLVVLNTVTLGPMRALTSFYRAGLSRASQAVLRPAVPTSLSATRLIGNTNTTIDAGATSATLCALATEQCSALQTQVSGFPLGAAATRARVLVISLLHSFTSMLSITDCLHGCKGGVSSLAH